MIRYFKNSRSLALIFALFICSCTSVDDNLGAGVVPPLDKLKIVNDTVETGFSIRSIRMDSMISDISSSYYLGSTTFPRMGRLDASFVTQVAVGNLPKEGVFPDGVVVDSAFMILGQDGYIGQSGYDLNLSIFELKKPLPYHRDSTYFTNFPIKDYISSTPDLEGTITSSKSIYLRLEPSFVEKYLKATKEQNKDYKLFNEAFFGYYLKTSSTFGAGALYNINTANSGIKIYYRDSESSSAKKEYNLTFAHIVKNQNTGISEVICEGFSFFDRDFSFVDPSFDFDPTSTTKSYAMGLDGFITELTIPQEFIEKIRGVLSDNPNNILGILRAELSIPIKDASIAAMDASIPFLGLYYNYQGFEYMPSYKPNNSDGLGGELNRVRGEYLFNVTSYIQDLVRNKKDKYTIQVAPKIGDSFTFKSSELTNTPERPIRLTITYTTNK